MSNCSFADDLPVPPALSNELFRSELTDDFLDSMLNIWAMVCPVTASCSVWFSCDRRFSWLVLMNLFMTLNYLLNSLFDLLPSASSAFATRALKDCGLDFSRLLPSKYIYRPEPVSFRGLLLSSIAEFFDILILSLDVFISGFHLQPYVAALKLIPFLLFLFYFLTVKIFS